MPNIEFECPECRQPLQVDDTAGGQQIACPSCSKQINIPFATPAETDDEQNGLLASLEKLLKRMIWGIFKFIFCVLPQKIYQYLVKSFPWFIRLLRVLFYGCTWTLLVFWPFAVIYFYPIDPTLEYITYLAYAWTAFALIGSFWGIFKWTALHRTKKLNAKKKKNSSDKSKHVIPPPLNESTTSKID